jgi:hypothetical protein
MDMEARSSWKERLRAAGAGLASSGARLRGWVEGHREGREPRAAARIFSARRGDSERFGRYIRAPERIEHISRGGVHVPAIIHKDWVVLVPPIARTVLFVVLAIAWHDHPWWVLVVLGVLLALRMNRRGLTEGRRLSVFWALVVVAVTAYLALAVVRPWPAVVQILLVVVAALLWLAHDGVLWFYDVLILTNFNLYREFVDVHGLDYEYRKACGDLRSFTYNEPRLPLTTWRVCGAIFRRPDLGIMQFESAVQFDKPLNSFGPITHVNTFRTQFVQIREGKLRGPTPPPVNPL